ncbi:MAG TPA: diguanylate cyclase [Symbiobacteriaceae bacterium]|nr:diguanylate cyclase [Symbiobacteriaceae bacterium]
MAAVQSVLKDPLTGAHSRAALQERFHEETERSRRHTLPLTIILMDIDHFKSINDAFGHLRGDEALVECVRRIQAVIRSSDLIFRWGGDEFVLLLPHTDKLRALAVAQRLLDGIRSTSFGGTPPIRVTASLGIATYPQDGETPERLFAVADARHYAAKRNGRNQVVAEDHAQVEERLLSEVSRLIERDEAQEALQSFFDTLPLQKTGVLAIAGPRGSGRTRFLTEVSRAARLRGFAVLNLRGSAALRVRAFGALTEAVRDWSGLASPTEGSDVFQQSLRQLLAHKEAAGLVISVDGLTDLDPYSIRAIRDLFAAGTLPVLALAYTTDPYSNRPPLSLDAALQQTVPLLPLTPAGIQLWLRSALRWEPPVEFAEWLCQETQGLPAAVERGLQELAEQHVLVHTADGWRLASTYVHTRLRRRLDELAGTAPSNLPAASTSFIGRENELRTLKEQLGDKRLITVLGPGGSGKSRLAAQAAAEVERQFRNGVYFVPLAAVESIDMIVPTIAAAMGFPLSGPGAPKLQLLGYLKEMETLLVLDNMEHLIEGADLITEIMQAAPRVSILATSRERLHVPGEAILELGGLPTPPADAFRTASLSGSALLFVERARLLNDWFTLTPENAPHVLRICQLVAGMPLGIELAAVWVRVLSCEEIADGIANSPDILATAAPDLPERHKSLRNVFAHSWNLLSGPEQQAFAQLSVFRGGFAREAAERVAGTSLLLLSALLDKSLLLRTGPGRYAVHELLRQYGAAMLETEQAAAVEERHARYYLHLAELLARAVTGPDQVNAFERLSAEHDNLRTALTWAIRIGSAEVALRISGALWQFWWRRGHLAEGRRWLEAALQVDAEADGGAERTHARAVALFAAAKLGMEQEGSESALRQTEESVRLFQMTGDQDGLARALAELGHAHRKHGNYDQARACFDESLVIRRQTGDTSGICAGLVGLGLLALSQGDYQGALSRLQETLSLQRGLGNKVGVIQAQTILATIHMVVGEYSQAEALLGESLRQIDRADIYSLSITLALLGESALAQNDLARAKPLLLESLSLKQVANLQAQLPDTLLNLGCLARRSGDAVEARSRFREALTCLQHGGDRRNMVNGLALAAAAACMTGQTERAARLLGAVEATSTAMGYALNLAFHQEYSDVVGCLAEQLHTNPLLAARTAGRELTLEQAVTYALSEEGD